MNARPAVVVGASATRACAVGAASTRSLLALDSPVTLTVIKPGPDCRSYMDRAEAVMRDVERSCSRCDPTGDLARANVAPDRWHHVSATLAAVVEEAERAHRETGGLYDPRRALTAGAPAPGEAPWRPEVARRQDGWQVRLGEHPVDLDGITGGLSLRWAADELADAGSGFLVDAGKVGALGGVGPTGGGWRVGVEDPADTAELVLMLQITDAGCATSSTTHVPDASSGRAGDPLARESSLAAVTVVAPDAAWSEILSNALLLGGADGIRSRADYLRVAAAWIDQDGRVGTSAAMDPLVIWRRPHA